MKLLITAGLFAFCFTACQSTVDNLPALPGSPTSVDAVKKALAGKSYSTTDVGLLSPFKADSTIAWMSASEDTTTFFTSFRNERMAYTLQFLNDTAFEGMDEGKAIKGKYTVDDETSVSQFDEDDSELPGIKLRLTVADAADSATAFAGMQNMTYTNYVKGISDGKLLLALPREMNRRKIVALMKSN